MFQKIQSYFFLILLVLLFSCKSEAEKLAEKTAVRNAKIDSTIHSFEKNFLKENIDSVFAQYEFNGSVAVIKNDSILYEKVNGYENFKDKTKIDSISVFAIASVSKQFTAVLVLMQEDLGKLSTGDKVSKYLEEFQTRQFENITIKELLNHTSGISDFGNGLLSKPGTEFHYSNKGFRFLGEIIEKVSGKSYDENAKNLFAKVGMTHTSTSNIFNENHFASAYTGTPSHFQLVENMPKRLSNDEISVPAGGILSTINDLHLWNTALYNGKILKPESFTKFSQKSADRNHQILGKMDYGFGIMMNVEKPLAYFHTGYVKGSPSLNIYYPETKTSVIILSNIANQAQGKTAVFQPHKKIKIITDSLQNSVVKMRSKLLNAEVTLE